MVKSSLPKSLRKFLRREKARIRRELFDSREAENKIHKLAAEIRERYNGKKYMAKHST